MRLPILFSAALSLLASSASYAAVTGPQAKPTIVKALAKAATTRAERGPWKTSLGGKAGDKLRPFEASNIRKRGGLHTGGVAVGTLNMKTEKVKVMRFARVRSGGGSIGIPKMPKPSPGGGYSIPKVPSGGGGGYHALDR